MHRHHLMELHYHITMRTLVIPGILTLYMLHVINGSKTPLIYYVTIL